MSFRDELIARLPSLVFGMLAGKLGGPQALGSFQQGMATRGRYEDEQARYADEQARQADLDAQRMEQQEYERGRQAEADRRAAESAQLQRLQAALGTLDRFSVGVGETATDPVAAENQILQRGTGLETAFGLPQGQLSPFVPNMAPAVSARKKRIARELYADAEKLYGAEALANDAITLQSELFGDVKPSQLRAIFATPAVTPTGDMARPMVAKPDVPNTPEERLADALKRGDTAEVQRLTQAAELMSGARRDPQMTDINRQLAELRLEQARTAKSSGALPPATQRRVDIKTRAFDQQPVVKRIQTMAEATTFAEGLDPNTTNPADDQAIIYAFAKAMDPDSVVREGEYAVVQKYAQSWAERFGFEAARIFSNTTFLTPQARQNMKATIRARFAAARPQYENLRRSYATQISRITGQSDGEDYLIDYAAGFPAATAAQTSGADWVEVEPGVRVRQR